MGRYKFNKKLSLWARIAGRRLILPVAHPATGELLFEDGHVLSTEDARLLDAVGVAEVVVDVDGREPKVTSNRM